MDGVVFGFSVKDGGEWGWGWAERMLWSFFLGGVVW